MGNDLCGSSRKASHNLLAFNPEYKSDLEFHFPTLYGTGTHCFPNVKLFLRVSSHLISGTPHATPIPHLMVRW
jgi:hypothetical protein